MEGEREIDMKPILTLYDIFGPGCIFNGRASYYNSQWLPSAISQDSSFGSLLTVAGETSILCHRDVIGPSCLSNLKDADLQVAQNLYLYEGEKSYYKLLNNQEKNQKMIINYSHLPGELDVSFKRKEE